MGSNPIRESKFRINYPEIMEGSKLPIDYGVMVHRDRNWSSGLRFESLLISKIHGDLLENLTQS